MRTCLTSTRYLIAFVAITFLLVSTLSGSPALAESGAPVVYSYNDPGTGTIVSYVGIPGGPAVYNNLGPGGIKSVTSVSSGNPVVYSNMGLDGITSVSYVSPGGPAVYSSIGKGGITSITINNGDPR